ncbi:transcriptional regulator [Kribbella qitaiheensis]|uniref:Transcriptional regulator n=1 Tax=Kribbella qitaiheensis TaxID=1544730 RepID=A0A7G6X5Q0_9ACTN|nr:winged helix-turn-helix domain-containing protein [Kribbella qitaiheensis]QNE21565.1 transcriptional regulator [Kribbella qitaiheensis]
MERPLLDESGPSVGLLLAPAGSGKTTLLAQVAATPLRPTAWYRARPEDRTEDALVQHVTEALSVVLPTALTHSTTVDQLILATENGVPAPVQLIVDDVHELAGSPAELALERFLEFRPRHLRLLLGSRRPLALNTPRLIVSGDLLELDSDDLRFRSWEVEELFRSVYRQPLSPEAAAALTRRTGGWAAGLQLFHLATMGKSSTERIRAATELGGRSRLVRAYLTRNVLAGLAPERRKFLLVTSALGRLTGPLCDELLEQPGSAVVLEELETLQFFTTSTDDGATYKYHQVLQTHLEGLLIDELGATASREIHGRSGQLLEKAGHPREAMRAYALADDWASVARLLQQGNTVAHDWVARSGLPDDDPWLALARARRLFRSGSVAAAVAAYRAAEALLDDPDFQSRCANERAQAEVWMPQPPAQAVPVRRTGQAMRQAMRRLPGLGPGVDAGPGVAPLAVGTIALLAGQFELARELLLRVAADSSVRSAGRLWAAIAVVVTDLALGNWSHAEVPLEEIALSAELDELPWLARVARGLQAAVLLATRPEDWRLDGCSSMADDCARDGDHWGSLLMATFVGAAQLKAGNDQVATTWLRRAATEAAGLEARVPQAWILALGAVAMAQLRQPGAAAQLTEAESLIRSAAVPGAHRLLDQARQLAEAAAIDHTSPGGSTPIANSPARLHTLGGFRLEVGGQAVQWPPLRPRARALLLLLAINPGKDLHRERLIDALWPDAPAEAGTHRLQVAASNVRQCLTAVGLSDHAVQRNGDAYRLVLPDAWIDLTEFERQLRQARRSGTLADWSRVLDLYVGELLPEVGAAEWVLSERERYRLAAADAAVQVAGLAEDAQALRAAHRAVELDSLRDSSWLLLADLQAEQGDPTAAAATRREYARVCAELAAPVSPRERPGRDG